MKSKGKLFNKKTGIIFIILAFVFCLCVTVLNNTNTSNSKTPTTSDIISEENKVNAIVSRVIDGDTLLVEINGNEERVRLIGVDTPESVNPDQSKNSKEGKEASDYTKSIIKEGQIVYLEYDKETNDKYGRTLAYVWLTDDIPTVPTMDEISEYMLNGILLSNGYAKTMKIKPNTKYSYRFDLIEMKAKSNSEGFWKDYFMNAT